MRLWQRAQRFRFRASIALKSVQPSRVFFAAFVAFFRELRAPLTAANLLGLPYPPDRLRTRRRGRTREIGRSAPLTRRFDELRLLPREHQKQWLLPSRTKRGRAASYLAAWRVTRWHPLMPHHSREPHTSRQLGQVNPPKRSAMADRHRAPATARANPKLALCPTLPRLLMPRLR